MSHDTIKPIEVQFAEVTVPISILEAVWAHVPTALAAEFEAAVGRTILAADFAGTAIEERLVQGWGYLHMLSSNSEYVSSANPADGFEVDNLGALVKLNIAYPKRTAPRDPFVPPVAVHVERVVTDPLQDSEVTKAVHDLLEGAVFATNEENLFNALTGLSRYIVENDTSPVMRRLRDLVQATAKLSLSEARYRLQVALTENGLGRINGLDITEFEKLDSEALASVMLAANKAYKNTTLAGALYYVARKGTDREEFNVWYDQLVAKHGWTRDGAENAFKAAAFASVDCDATWVSKFSTDGSSAYLEVLMDAGDKEDLDQGTLRQFALKAFDTPEGTRRAADLLMERPSRTLAELVSLPSIPPFESAAALLKAQAAGVASDDDHVLTAMEYMPGYLRVFLIRQPDDRQNFFFESMRLATARSEA